MRETFYQGNYICSSYHQVATAYGILSKYSMFHFLKTHSKNCKGFSTALFQGNANFFCQGPFSKYLSFTGSVTTMHLCHSVNPAIDDIYMNKHGCVLIKLTETACWIWPINHSLPTFCLSFTRDKSSYSTEK